MELTTDKTGNFRANWYKSLCYKLNKILYKMEAEMLYF